jgi:hypothetical protein
VEIEKLRIELARLSGYSSAALPSNSMPGLPGSS